MRHFIALLTAVCGLSAQTVEGTVTNSASGAPVAGANVTLESNGKAAYQTTTNPQGAFHIENVAPGVYHATFFKTDFMPMADDAPEQRAFSVAAGNEPVHLQARLTPFGKVIGRVLDANGDPVAGAELLLDSAMLAITNITDAEGKFTFQAAPGRYRLLATPPRNLKTEPPGKKDGMGWVPTYYPRAIDAAAAAPIVVRPGAELWGTDVRLTSAPMRRVHGVVLDPDGHPAAGADIRIARNDETLEKDLRAKSGEDGGFEYPTLYDGEWSLFAQLSLGGVKLMAAAAVTVGDRDLDRLELRLSAPFVLPGKISYLGNRKSGDAIPVFLRPRIIAGSRKLPQANADPDADGAIRIPDVYPGEYKIIANAPAPPYYLASLTMGGRDILGQYVSLDPASAAFEAVFDTNGGAVHGKIEDCGNSTIVLAPQNPALHEAQFVRVGKCGDDGRFEITDVRPGDYYAFAFNRWDGPMELLESLGDALIRNAVSVHVNSGESAAADLRITNREF